MNQIFVFGVAFTLLFSQLSCSGAGNGPVRNESAQQQQPEPVIELKLDRKLRLTDRLVFKWRVLNSGFKPIFLFSTPLEPGNAAFAEVELNAEQKTIRVKFLKSRTSAGLPPYSFPKIHFKQLNPGEYLEGTFESNQPIAQSDIYVRNGDKLNKTNIGSVSWSLQMNVAWNTEIDSVRQALQKSAEEGQEHPFNPVTRWQMVATSPPVVIALEG